MSVEHFHKICPAVWFSGFFGLGAFVHLVRLLFRFPVMVGGYDIPMAPSAVIVVLLGALSVGLLWVGIRRPCCPKE